MRRLLPLVLIAAAGCGPGEAWTAAQEEERDRIFCRIGEARQFERFCTLERGESEAGPTLTVRKPDGGFRRLRLTGEGAGIAAADGAEEAEVVQADADTIEVSVGGDTFRLPASAVAR